MFSSARFKPFDQPFLLRSVPSLREGLEQLCVLMEREPTFYEDLLSTGLKDVLIWAVSLQQEDSGVYPAVLDDIRRFLDDHFTEPLSNSEVAARFGYHSYYLNKLFAAHFGQTIHVYLNRRKLRFAKQLLLSTDKSISQIAAEAGFSSAAWFSEYFRENTGVSPSRFR